MIKPTIKIRPRTMHGGMRFYPADEFSAGLLAVFERGKRVAYTFIELKKLEHLGFKVIYIGYLKEEVRNLGIPTKK